MVSENLQLVMAANEGLPAGVLVVYLLIGLVVVAGMWKVFSKAGKPGWAVLVPIYNIIVLLDIAGKPAWWFVLFLIPIVNAVVAILVSLAIAERFGKGAGFGIGLAFLGFIFYPILGFGSATYRGAAAHPGMAPAA